MAALFMLTAPWRAVAALLNTPLQPSAAQTGLPGGWSDVADLSASGDEYQLAEFAFSQLQASNTTAATALEGASISAPLTSAQTQVVSGINHQIVAQTNVGALSLAMYEQAWTSTLTLNEAKLDGDVVADNVALDYDAYINNA